MDSIHPKYWVDTYSEEGQRNVKFVFPPSSIITPRPILLSSIIEREFPRDREEKRGKDQESIRATYIVARRTVTSPLRYRFSPLAPTALN